MGFEDWTADHLAGKRDPIQDGRWDMESWWPMVAAQLLKLSLVVTWENVSEEGTALAGTIV